MERARHTSSILAAVLAAISLPAWADNGTILPPPGTKTITQAEALADIAKVNQFYHTQTNFRSSDNTAAQQTGDVAAQAAGQQYDRATTDSLNAATDHRNGNEARAVAPAAQSSANSMNGPIARHEAQGQQYEQDASNAENYVCTATNKKGQCTAGYWNCNSTCQYYRGLAQHQFHIASIDQGQQSAMQGQANQLQALSKKDAQLHVQNNAKAQYHHGNGNRIDVQGGADAGAYQLRAAVAAQSWGKQTIDNETQRIIDTLHAPESPQPYTLPKIPAPSTAQLQASAQGAQQLADRATALANIAMGESRKAAEAYRQMQAYQNAEKQAQQQAATDAANAASAPTPSSRAAWASAAAAMRAQAAADARKAAAQKTIYEAQKKAAEQHALASESPAQQSAQIQDRAASQVGKSIIAPYLQ